MRQVGRQEGIGAGARRPEGRTRGAPGPWCWRVAAMERHVRRHRRRGGHAGRRGLGATILALAVGVGVSLASATVAVAAPATPPLAAGRGAVRAGVALDSSAAIWAASDEAAADAAAGNWTAAAALWTELVRVWAHPANAKEANDEAVWWSHLAAYDARVGRWAAAFAAVQEEASYDLEAGNRAAATWVLEQDAAAELRAGRSSSAAADWLRLIGLYAASTRPGDANNVALWWRDLRHLYLQEHRAAAAQAAFVQELRYFARAGQENTVVWKLEQQAEESVRTGDMAQAAWDWEQLIPIYARPANPNQANDEALFYRRLGRYLLSQKEYAAAAQDFALEAQYWKAADRAAWGDLDQQVARTVRPELMLFAEESAGAAPSGPQAKFAPPWGTYVGFYAQGDPGIGNAVARIPTVYGRRPAILLYYLDWGQPLPSGDVAAARQLGAALEIALQPEQGLGPVLSDTTYLPSLVRSLAAAGVPVFLRFAGEMNGAWTPWGANPDPGQPAFDAHAAQYIAAFRRVAAAVHAGAPNVAMVWAPNDMPQTGTEAYYPGDAYVDWVGVSAYLPHSLLGAPDVGAAGHWIDLLDWIVAHYPQKPVMVTEGAVTHYDRVTGSDVTSWAEEKIRGFFAALPLLDPQVKAVVYWSSIDATSDYALADSAAVAQALDAATASPWYLDRVGASAPVRFVPLKDGAALAAGATVEAFAQDAHGVAAVRYTLDGQSIGAPSAPPYAVVLPRVAPGSHTLVAEALSATGAVLRVARLSLQLG